MTEGPQPTVPPEGRRFVMSRDFFKALHAAGLLPEYPMVRRVVIDCNTDDAVVGMYVDRIPASALLEIPALMTVPAVAPRVLTDEEIAPEPGWPPPHPV